MQCLNIRPSFMSSEELSELLYIVRHKECCSSGMRFSVVFLCKRALNGHLLLVGLHLESFEALCV